MLYSNYRKREEDDGMIDRDSCLIFIKELEVNIERRMNNEMKELDMTMTQARALSLLLDFPERQATLKHLEKSLQLSQSVTAGIIKRLELRRYVECFGDAEDKRIKIVRITPLGEQQWQRAEKILRQLERDVLSCLTEQEAQSLKTLLKKVKSCNER